MFYIAVFVLSWTVWLLFADKRRWRELFATSVFGIALAAITADLVHHYKLWEYPSDKKATFWISILDEFGIYVVVIYLFIQWLPKKKTFGSMLSYWFLWTAFAIGIEYVFFLTGHIKYYKWWNPGFSYAADWLLYWIFYMAHKTFRLERLSV